MQRTNPVSQAVLLELLAHAAWPACLVGHFDELVGDHVEPLTDHAVGEACAAVAPASSIDWTRALDGRAQVHDSPADVCAFVSHVGGAR